MSPKPPGRGRPFRDGGSYSGLRAVDPRGTDDGGAEVGFFVRGHDELLRRVPPPVPPGLQLGPGRVLPLLRPVFFLSRRPRAQAHKDNTTKNKPGVVAGEEFTGAHFDSVYMGRGSQDLMTTWIPLGDYPVE